MTQPHGLAPLKNQEPHTHRLILGYIGIMEKKMETTIMGYVGLS